MRQPLSGLMDEPWAAFGVSSSLTSGTLYSAWCHNESLQTHTFLTYISRFKVLISQSISRSRLPAFIVVKDFADTH